MAASPTASASGSVAAAAAAASEANDGPVLSVVSKRLRALRKKQNRISQMEEAVAAGKKLNREQEEVLRSKPVVAALIDELERLRAPLSSALAEELSSRPATPAPSSSDSDSSIQDLLALVYFGSLFDVKSKDDYIATMVEREHERNCCLNYDAVTDDAVDLLVEKDLDEVSTVAALAAARPLLRRGFSHRDALQACAQHTRLWLSRANEPISPDSAVTYAAVRAKLDRIMASNYYSDQSVVSAEEVESYGAGCVQAQESMAVSPEEPEVEENLAAEGDKDEKEDLQATGIYTDQTNEVDAQNVDDEGLVSPPEECPSAEAEQEKFEYVEEQDQRNAEPQDQEFTAARRSYQNQRGGRGGGRRGFSYGRGRGGRGMVGGYQNGRGGGGYQSGGGYQNGRGAGYQGGGGGYHNGRGGYYYESGYQQQRNYNRGRGGRSGGNSFYNNPQEGHPGRVELGANA